MLHRASAVCFVVAVGATMRTAVALRIGIGAIQATGTATAGSRLFSLQFVEAKKVKRVSEPRGAEREGARINYKLLVYAN